MHQNHSTCTSHSENSFSPATSRVQDWDVQKKNRWTCTRESHIISLKITLGLSLLAWNCIHVQGPLRRDGRWTESEACMSIAWPCLHHPPPLSSPTPGNCGEIGMTGLQPDYSQSCRFAQRRPSRSSQATRRVMLRFFCGELANGPIRFVPD